MKTGCVLAALVLALSGPASAQVGIASPSMNLSTVAPPSVAPVPVIAPAPAGPRVTMTTSMGEIVLSLDAQRAPKTVANFLRYVKAGYFNNIQIYRIEPGFLLQMGAINSKGVNRPALFPPIPLETDTGLKHARGAVAMAHGDDPNSANHTFYIDLAENASLNAKEGAKPNTTGYAVFGAVIEGMDTVDKIAAVETGAPGPFPGKAPKVPVIVKKIAVSP